MLKLLLRDVHNTKRPHVLLSKSLTKMITSPKVGEKRRLDLETSQSEYEKKSKAEEPIIHKSEAGTTEHDVERRGSNVRDKDKISKGTKKYRKKLLNIEPCSHEDIFWREVASILGEDAVDTAIREGNDFESPFNVKDEIDLHITKLSSNGCVLLNVFTN